MGKQGNDKWQVVYMLNYIEINASEICNRNREVESRDEREGREMEWRKQERRRRMGKGEIASRKNNKYFRAEGGKERERK